MGVQQSAIYNHFDGKQSILFELLLEHMHTLLNAVDAVMDVHRDPATQLEQFVDFHTSYHIDFPDDVFIAYMELRSLDADNRDQLITLRNQYEAKLKQILDAGIESGDFACADASVHTRALIAMLTGVTVWYQDNGRLNKPEVVACYVKAALQSVGLQA